MMTVEEALADIRARRANSTYKTKSQKDEVEVCRAMMNDKGYQVTMYAGDGAVGVYNPARSFRGMISNVMSETTGISKIEADNLLDKHEFSSSQAKEMVNFSKEFFNTYLFKSGRKLSLGGRENSDVDLEAKTIPAGFVKYPVKVGEDSEGHAICESREAYVGEYDTLKVYGPFPMWRKNKIKGI